MANKTQFGIGAAIALLVAAYFGIDANQLKNETQTGYSQQHQIDNSKNTLPQIVTNSNIESHSSSQNQHGLEVIRKAYDSKLSNVQVQSIGKVKAILRDDNEGTRHQKFILSLDNGLTVLVAHNIDLAPRIENLKKGDSVEFFGEYEYSNQGGVVHWTHRDPSRRHTDGWLKHDGKTYQ